MAACSAQKRGSRLLRSSLTGRGSWQPQRGRAAPLARSLPRSTVCWMFQRLTVWCDGTLDSVHDTLDENRDDGTMWRREMKSKRGCLSELHAVMCSEAVPQATTQMSKQPKQIWNMSDPTDGFAQSDPANTDGARHPNVGVGGPCV